MKTINEKVVDLSIRLEKSVTEIANDLRISRGRVYRVLKNYKKTGSVIFPKNLKYNATKIFEPAKMFIQNLISDDPSVSVADIRVQLSKKYGLEISKSHIYAVIKKMGFRRALAAKKLFLSETHISKRKNFVERFIIKVFK